MDGLVDWVTDVVETVGYAGVAFLVALENVFPPIPSEVVLPLAGFVAGRGDANFVGMVAAATLGSVVGALVLYGIAAWIGEDRLRNIVLRYGKWLGVREPDIDRAMAWFERRGSAAVLLGRCVPLIRSLVSIPAGFTRIPLTRFVILTTIGSAVWNVALIGAGAALGDRWEKAGDWVEILQYLVIAAIVLGVAYWLWTRLLIPRFTRKSASGQ